MQFIDPRPERAVITFPSGGAISVYRDEWEMLRSAFPQLPDWDKLQFQNNVSKDGS